MLQDAHLWFDNYPNHFITNHVGTYINRIEDETLRNGIMRFLIESKRNISLIKNTREKELRHNSIKEANINQQTAQAE